MVVRTCHCFVQFLAQTSWTYCIIGVYFGSIWPALKKLRPSTLSLVHFEELRLKTSLCHTIHSLIWYFKISFISYLYLFFCHFLTPKLKTSRIQPWLAEVPPMVADADAKAVAKPEEKVVKAPAKKPRLDSWLPQFPSKIFNSQRNKRNKIPKELGGGNSNIFYFHPYLGKIPILTHIFQMGWNHQLEKDWYDSHLSIHFYAEICTIWHFRSFFEGYPP